MTTVVNFINILRAAFAPIFLQQKLQRQAVTRVKLCKALSYKKGKRKMLMKLTPGDVVVDVVAAVCQGVRCDTGILHC